MASDRLDVMTIGECLVEIMRDKRDVPHSVPGTYLGPYPSGAPAIFADACARLGLRSGIIGAVGRDDFGKLLVERLRGDGVEVSRLKVLDDRTTGVAFVTYFSTGSRQFIFHIKHAAAGQIYPEDVDPEYVRRFKLLHIMGSSLSINDNCREACYKAVEIAKRSGMTITFDPNLRPELLDVSTIRSICKPVLEAAKVVLPSGVEAEALTGVSDPVKAGRKLLEHGPELAVIKLGEKGSIAVTRDGVVEASAIRVREVDPTGAGDVYDAAFVLGLLEGWPLNKILSFANAAGAIKVTRFGPMEGPLSRGEVEELLKRSGGWV